MIERVKRVITAHKKALLVILLILLLLILGIAFSKEEQPAAEKPAVMTQEKIQNAEFFKFGARGKLPRSKRQRLFISENGNVVVA